MRHAADLRLVTAALAGKPGARREFAERLAQVPGMLRHRNRHLATPLDPDALDEAAQEVMAAAWARLGTYAGRSSLATWLYGFCVFELHKSNAKIRRRLAPLSNASDVPDAEPSRGNEDVRAALADLEHELREPIELRFFERRTLEEIAKLSATPLSTIKGRYYRGMDQLRRMLSATGRSG